MDRSASTFSRILIFVFIVQTINAISHEEYVQRSTEIKSRPEVAKFLKDNEYVISKFGVFFDKLADIFAHVRKTQQGSDTINVVHGVEGEILNQPKTFDIVQKIINGFKDVLTTEIGVKNALALAKFIQSELVVPHLFQMCISLKKTLFALLLSKDGVKALVHLKENQLELEGKDDYNQLMAIIDKEFPIFTLGGAAKNKSTGRMQSIMKKLFS